MRHIAATFIVCTLAAPLSVYAQVNVLTNRYDNARTGANLNETILTVGNVNVNRFGKLYSYPVDGAVYAQPLYVQGVTINGSVRNVLYVATMNDKVYAFDADSTSPTPLWARDFTNPPAVTAVPITDLVPPNLNIIGNVGIESTPVIDTTTGTLYVVVRTKEGFEYVQRLHALDIRTGLSRPGSPATIQASVQGNAPDSTASLLGRTIAFDPKMQNQRAALALTQGVVLIAWGSHEDKTPYHGWVMAYDAMTLAQIGVFAAAPDHYFGGVWQAGRAPAVDAAGSFYLQTGNAVWDGRRNFGDSVLKFSLCRLGPNCSNAIGPTDYFTPSNHNTLDVNDLDLGSSGVSLLPDTDLVIAGGKEGVIYLLRAGNLGHEAPNDAQVVQKLAVNGSGIFGGPVVWKSATAGPLVFNWSTRDVLKAFHFNGATLDPVPYARGSAVSPGHPGGVLSVSANGNTARTGIVWASMPTSQDGMHGLVAGIVRAYDAETLRELWNTEQNPARDRIGTLMKFVPPVVVNGKLYMPNHDNAVVVYGLLP
jgi:hypothetical protein